MAGDRTGPVWHARDRIGGQSAPPVPGRQGTKLPDYVVLISALDGIEVFGLNGFFIGPLIVLKRAGRRVLSP